MHIFEQLPIELSVYINDFVIEQTARENFQKVINQINDSFISQLNPGQIPFKFEHSFHYKLKPLRLLNYFHAFSIEDYSISHMDEKIQYYLLIENKGKRFFAIHDDLYQINNNKLIFDKIKHKIEYLF